MQTYSNVEEFSRDLFLSYLYRNEFPLPEKDLDSLKIPKCIETVCETLGRFCDGFCESFLSIFEKQASRIFKTEEQLLDYAMPRVLMLCEKPTYFSFMLVCAFIAELVHHFGESRNCYRFRGTAHKCFIVVFNREFRAGFEVLGGLEGLGLFCEGHNTVITTRKRGETFGKMLTETHAQSEQEVLDLIIDCDNVENEGIPLTHEELSLISSDDFSAATGFDFPNRTSDPGPFEFEWKLGIGPHQLPLTTKVDFETAGVYFTTDAPRASTEASKSLEVVFQGKTGVEVDEVKETLMGVDSLREECSERSRDSTEFYDCLSKVLDSADSSSDEEGVMFGRDSRPSSPLMPLPKMISGLASVLAPLFEGEKFYSRLLAHVCKYCDKKCYAYSMHCFRNHRDSCANHVELDEET